MMRRLFSNSLYQRLILGVSGVIFFSIGIMTVVDLTGIPGTDNKGSLELQRSVVLNDLELLSGIIRKQVNNWFLERRKDVESLSSSPFLRRAVMEKTSDSRQSLTDELQTFFAKNAVYTSLAVVETGHGSLLSGLGEFRDARTPRDIFISPEELARYSTPGYQESIDIRIGHDRKERFRIIRQIFSAQEPQRIPALLVVEIDLDTIIPPVLWTITSHLLAGWECILAGSFSGETNGYREYSRKNVVGQSPAVLSTFAPVKLAISGLEGPYDGPDENGTPVLAFYRQVRIDPKIAFALILKIDQRIALNPAWQAIVRQIIRGFFLLGVGIGVIMLMARQIVHPLRDLANVAQKIENGDLTARAAESRQVEIGLLSSVFNRMVGRLQHWQQELEQKVDDRTRELRESEEKFRSVFESANVGKCISLPTGELNPNKAFADMLGYTQVEMQSKTWQELTPPEEIGQIQQQLAPLLRGEKDSTRFEKKFVHKNSSLVWGDVSTVLQRDSCGKPLRFITAVVDITEKNMAKDELERHRHHLEELVRERTQNLEEKTVELERSQKAMQSLLEDVTVAKKELESKIAEVERMNRVFVDRELRMAELKKEIETLKQAQG